MENIYPLDGVNLGEAFIYKELKERVVVFGEGQREGSSTVA